MAEKPGFDVATGFQGGVTVGIHADNWEQFVAYCEAAWPGEGLDVARGLLQLLKNNAIVTPPTEGQAVQMLQSQLGAVPLPPEQYQPQQGYQQGYQQNDPNGPPPGQTHDPNDPEKTKWVKPGTIKNGPRAGQSYPGFWAYPDGHPNARRR